MRTEYEKQAKLALTVLQSVSKEKCFALKGGTAINFFIRNLPRLSVDIDLTYVKFAGRAESIKEINAALNETISRLKQVGVKSEITLKAGDLMKIRCFNNETEIKIDMNYISRGFAFEPIVKTINPEIANNYEFVEMQIVSIAELYGGENLRGA